MSEIWKPLDAAFYDTPNRYVISNHGRVARMVGNERRLLRPQKSKGQPRLQVALYGGEPKRLQCYVSRLVAHHFIRPLRDDDAVIYADGDRTHAFHANLKVCDINTARGYDPRKQEQFCA